MTPIQLFHYRIAAATLLDYAVNGVKGRDELDAVYQSIVEGRDGPDAITRAKYSSCADLAHWVWWRLGCRHKLLNREERTVAKGDFKYGVNLNRWHPPPIGPNPYAVKPKAADFNPGAGDIVTINNSFGGHVTCVMGWDAKPRALYTAEYGQPGGRQRVHFLQNDSNGGLQFSVGKPLVSWARLDLALADASNWSGMADIECLRGWTADEAVEAMKKGMKKGMKNADNS